MITRRIRVPYNAIGFQRNEAQKQCHWNVGYVGKYEK